MSRANAKVEPAADPEPPPARTIGSVARVATRSFGEIMVTFGLIVLLLAAFEIWGKGAAINSHQNDLNHQLAQAWGDPTVSPSPGATPGAPPPNSVIARLYIPKLNLHWVIVEGVSLSDIRYAPGHYPGTAMPGQVGNFSVAGHREPGMFWDLDKVVNGDMVVVETKTNWYVYRVFENHIVTPHSVEVVAAVPNQPNATPVSKDLTLTTCNPKWDNYQRMAVHATLITTYPHSTLPSELGGVGSGA
jgi:sortase A